MPLKQYFPLPAGIWKGLSPAGFQKAVEALIKPLYHTHSAIVENAIRKREKIPEPECSQFVAATKARFLAERDNSIRRRLAAAKAQEPIMQGHDLSEKERFRPAARHMIMLEVQKQCFVGFKGERFCFYLSEQEGESRIKSLAAVVSGKLYPNKKPRQLKR